MIRLILFVLAMIAWFVSHFTPVPFAGWLPFLCVLLLASTGSWGPLWTAGARPGNLL
jgi:hypothetical protein